MHHTILITRSQPGASELKSALVATGYRVHVHSLIEIEPVETSISADHLAATELFIFVSAAAVRQAGTLIDFLGQLENSQIYAIGSATAGQLRAFGLKALLPERADSEGLLALPELLEIDGKRISIICGEGGRELLHSELVARGASVECVKVYRRVIQTQNIEHIDQYDAVVISSGEGLKALVKNTGSPGKHVPLLLPSRRVAQEAQKLGFTRCITCKGATSDAVLDGLDELF